MQQSRVLGQWLESCQSKQALLTESPLKEASQERFLRTLNLASAQGLQQQTTAERSGGSLASLEGSRCSWKQGIGVPGASEPLQLASPLLEEPPMGPQAWLLDARQAGQVVGPDGYWASWAAPPPAATLRGWWHG
ncbi:MAG TPA: hypothetical protein V6D06_08495 [Trichocoleus sp.]